MPDKSKIIVLIGGPGVGKGTFAKMLMKRGNYNYIGVGALLRQLPLDSEIQKTIANGGLVSDDVLFNLLSECINTKSDVLLDGFPRKLTQAQWLVEKFADAFDIHILNLVVPYEVLISRINKRIASGEARADDMDSEIIRSRLKTFLETTVPAIDWLRNVKKIKFSDVDVSGNLDNNLSEIISALTK